MRLAVRGRHGLYMALWLAASANTASAHNLFTLEPEAGFSASLLTLAGFLVVWLAYLRGSRNKRPTSGHSALFHLVLGISLVSLFGPLDTLAEGSTAVHMVQHMLVIGVIAPLWVISRPLPQIAAGARWSAPIWKWLLQSTRRPLLLAWLHAAAIWLWHTPPLYMLAVVNPWWHTFEHLAFLSTGLLFWWAALQGSVRHAPWATLALLFTLMHTGILGAILTFAPEPLYGEARSLADQQLAGLIMWVAGAVPYLIGAAFVVWRYYRQLDTVLPVKSAGRAADDIPQAQQG